MGIEVEAHEDVVPAVAPGLGLGVNPGLGLYKEILGYYVPLHFIHDDGSFNQVTVVRHVTKVLEENGLKPTNELQEVGGIWIYPRDYFNPLDDYTGKLNITSNTRSIHWYSRTWSDSPGWKIKLMRFVHVSLGENYLKLRRLFAR